MIHNIVTAISSRVNLYVKNRLLIDDDVVVVRNLVDLKGSISEGVQNKISVFFGLNNSSDFTFCFNYNKGFIFFWHKMCQT